MFQYEIVTPPRFEVNPMILEKIFSILNEEVKKNQHGTVNIIFVSPDEIQTLNRDYRQKDSVTDVLSFHYFEDFSNLKKEDIAGELVFCEEKILQQAQEYGLGNEKEFYKLLIHSLLHILGFDHEEDEEYIIMQGYEESIWKKIFEKN